MMISRKANSYAQSLDPDAELLKMTNDILKLLEEYEADYNLLFIKSQLFAARTAFLDACVYEMKYNLYEPGEKSKSRVQLESTIETFEKIREEICVE